MSTINLPITESPEVRLRRMVKEGLLENSFTLQIMLDEIHAVLSDDSRWEYETPDDVHERKESAMRIDGLLGFLRYRDSHL